MNMFFVMSTSSGFSGSDPNGCITCGSIQSLYPIDCSPVLTSLNCGADCTGGCGDGCMPSCGTLCTGYAENVCGQTCKGGCTYTCNISCYSMCVSEIAW